MENTITQSDALAQSKQMVQLIVNSWAAQNKTVTDFFSKYDENVYRKEIAAGRNRPIYILGHLIAINDGMLPLLGFGEKLFPELESIFITAPDKTINDLPTLTELKQHWEILNTTLSNHFNKMSVEQWLEKHNAVSQEDFALNPLRNKLNVLIGRTNHQSYHLGQLNLLFV